MKLIRMIHRRIVAGGRREEGDLVPVTDSDAERLEANGDAEVVGEAEEPSQILIAQPEDVEPIADMIANEETEEE